MTYYKIILLVLASSFSLNAQSPFITIWQTDNPGTSQDNRVIIPGTGSDYLIEWEEVDNPANNGSQIAINGHTVIFPSPGTYRITISGNFEQIEFNNGFWGGDKLKLVSIEQWGDIQWTTMNGAFSGCRNMVSNATDVPNLSRVSSTENMFSECDNFNGDLSGWDVSNVTHMQRMFFQATSFNQPIGDWDVSSVTNMQEMFREAESFNQPIDNWEVSRVENTIAMFRAATSFNQPIGDWDVSNVTTLQEMFGEAMAFNQPIGNWDVSSVTDMSFIFWDAASFNQPIGDWDVSRVINMRGMFYGTVSFNHPIGDWDVSNVTDVNAMFHGAVSFNQPIGGWDVSNVTDMGAMFAEAESFNQPIGDWDVSSVTGMGGMFRETVAFNQPIGHWDVSSAIQMAAMFRETVAFNQPIGDWEVSKVHSMHQMFWGAVSFNQPIGNWDVSRVTNMTHMFRESTSFDQPIGDWDVSNATVMYSMFEGAVSFNQPLDNWDVSTVHAMWSMFRGAESFNQDLGSWDLSGLLAHINLTPINLLDMFDHSGMSCKNYDMTLKGWNGNPTTPDSLILSSVGITYHDAAAARDSLINQKGWTITGDEFVEECITEDCDLPPTTITIQGEYPLCLGEELILRATADGVEYTWFKDGQPITGETDQLLVVTESGSYSVIYTDSDNCESIESEATEIHFLDGDDPPVLLNAGDVVVRSTQSNCRGFAFWEAEIEVCGNLSEIEKRSIWRLDLHNTGQFDILSSQPRPDGSLRDNLRIEEELPFGTHRVQWEIRDEHGNVVIEEQLLTLVDRNPPNPVCMHGLSTNLSPNTGRVTIPARAFDVASWDDCTADDDLHFTFSSDLTHTHHTWDCDDLDGEKEITFTVEIWVTNQYGHQNHCTTYLKVQDNRNTCPFSGILGPVVHRDRPTSGGQTALLNSGFSEWEEEQLEYTSFEIEPNRPNPFSDHTTIGFELPNPGSVELMIYDSYGQTIYRQSRKYPSGSHDWELSGGEFSSTGMYLYRMGFEGEYHIGRMIRVE